MSTVRTRIAPSPTGDPHVGTAYIALFNYCFAKQHGGEFILRIEDTDQKRSTAESEQAILDSLKWMGLQWDEGPDIGGEYGPYRQSERKALYASYAMQLVESGHAYYCFRTPEELDAIRAARVEAGLNPGIKGDLALPEEQVQQRLAANEPYVIRMNVPDEGVCVIEDGLRGTIEVEWSQVDHQILLKSDGMPTYHLANVVDDHLMKITHVIRGEEWISSAPKHFLLYQYFGWEMPKLTHMPLLRNPDKSKLSKRKNPTSIHFYQRMGFMPEAVMNYLGRMGWSMPDEREKFTLDEMVAEFDIQRVSLGGPVFDVEKLRWLNGQWLRELSPEAFIQQYQAWGLNREFFEGVIKDIQSRTEVFSDVVNVAGFLLDGLPAIQPEQFEGLKLESDDLKAQLQRLVWRFETLSAWEKDEIFACCKQLSEELELKIRDFLAPVFIAVSGKSASISVMDAMVILGSDMTRARLSHAIQVLGGISKKQMKKLEKLK